MKITWLGTAAAEGVPALFCDCPQCAAARKAGGQEIRTRAGALIDGCLKLDFGPDSYIQMLRAGLDFHTLENILITHTHEDHFAYWDIQYRLKPYSQLPESAPPLTVWGNARAGDMLAGFLKPGVLEFRLMEPFQPRQVGGYRVTALEAVHAREERALFYLIEKDGASILYAHDTDEFTEADMEFLAGRHIGLISMDCTNGVLELDYIGHMGLSDNLRMREKLLKCGAADARTVFVANHFSHNGVRSIGEMRALAPAMEIAWDGLTLETPPKG